MLVFGTPLQDVVNGALIIIVTVCSYFGIRKGIKATPPEVSEKKTVEVAGALVDNRAIDKLAGEISGHTLTSTKTNLLMEQLLKRIDDWFEYQDKEQERRMEERLEALERENERLRQRNERSN